MRLLMRVLPSENFVTPDGCAVVDMLVRSAPSEFVTVARGDLSYQASALPGVSRTFALTIPVLPDRLAEVVTNAYLLCRIADTIEDDSALGDQQKSEFHRQFLSVIKGSEGRRSIRCLAGAAAVGSGVTRRARSGAQHRQGSCD